MAHHRSGLSTIPALPTHYPALAPATPYPTAMVLGRWLAGLHRAPYMPTASFSCRGQTAPLILAQLLFTATPPPNSYLLANLWRAYILHRAGFGQGEKGPDSHLRRPRLPHRLPRTCHRHHHLQHCAAHLRCCLPPIAASASPPLALHIPTHHSRHSLSTFVPAATSPHGTYFLLRQETGNAAAPFMAVPGRMRKEGHKTRDVLCWAWEGTSLHAHPIAQAPGAAGE